MIILGLFLNIHRGLKIPFLSTLSHSLYAMCIFSCRRARLSLKEAFRVIFARNCNDRRRCRVSSSPIILSSSSTLSSISHLSSLFLSLSIFLSVYLFFFFASASVCGPATLPRCQYRHLEIICFSAHFWARCDRDRTVKVAIGIPPFVNFSNRFDMTC